MKRRSNRPILIIGALFVVVMLAYAALFIGYQNSVQNSTRSVETLAAQLHATAVATITR